MRTAMVVTIVACLTALGCGSSDSTSGGADGSDGDVPSDAAVAAMEGRLDELDAAVTDWREADTVEVAHAAAERAANLIVGPNGPDYGDRDGDGTVAGEAVEGLLPGLDGTPAGLAMPLASVDCVEADVLGGSWDDPAGRWATMNDAIDEWTPTGNTMPSLPSHPMRVVGWATFTLGSESLDDAHEYAGHARLHVDISRNALDC